MVAKPGIANTPDDTVALGAFVAVGVFAGFIRVNPVSLRVGAANRALRAFALMRCLHIVSHDQGGSVTLSIAESRR